MTDTRDMSAEEYAAHMRTRRAPRALASYADSLGPRVKQARDIVTLALAKGLKDTELADVCLEHLPGATAIITRMSIEQSTVSVTVTYDKHPDVRFIVTELEVEKARGL